MMDRGDKNERIHSSDRWVLSHRASKRKRVGGKGRKGEEEPFWCHQRRSVPPLLFFYHPFFSEVWKGSLPSKLCALSLFLHSPFASTFFQTFCVGEGSEKRCLLFSLSHTRIGARSFVPSFHRPTFPNAEGARNSGDF